jgi:hypothetical protein
MMREVVATAERDAVKVREAFAVLAQGLELRVYSPRQTGALRAQQTAVNQLVWMDADILRICADSIRPTLVDRALGKIPPGLYLRDISEVREGYSSLDFKQSATPPQDTDRCLALVGSERTICLEMPSKFARDWFLERFRCIVNDVLTDDERLSR